MPTPIEVVTAFMAEWGKGRAEIRTAVRSYFTPATEWENVGLSKTVGIDAAIALLDSFETVERIQIDSLAVAAVGNKVLTERIDRLIGSNGVEQMAVRLMGIFEVEADKILRWRDYLDTAPFAASAA